MPVGQQPNVAASAAAAHCRAGRRRLQAELGSPSSVLVGSEPLNVSGDSVNIWKHGARIYAESAETHLDLSAALAIDYELRDARAFKSYGAFFSLIEHPDV